MNKKHYKMIDEITGNVETFDSLDALVIFVVVKEIKLPVILEMELYEVIDDENIHKINLVNDDNTTKFSGMYIYKHVNDQSISYSFTSDFWNGSAQFETFDECLSEWFFSESESEEYDDVSCTSCGDGGCIHCRPSWFI